MIRKTEHMNDMQNYSLKINNYIITYRKFKEILYHLIILFKKVYSYICYFIKIIVYLFYFNILFNISNNYLWMTDINIEKDYSVSGFNL